MNLRTLRAVMMICGLALVAVLTALSTWCGELPRQHEGRCSPTYIVDGDTLSIAGERMRLAGIDAPEWNRPGGPEATAWLRGQLHDRAVSWQWSERDVYGRPLVTLWIHTADVGDWTRSINHRMMQAGHATVYVVGRHR